MGLSHLVWKSKTFFFFSECEQVPFLNIKFCFPPKIQETEYCTDTRSVFLKRGFKYPKRLHLSCLFCGVDADSGTWGLSDHAWKTIMAGGGGPCL